MRDKDMPAIEPAGLDKAVQTVIRGIEAGERRQQEEEARRRLSAAAPGLLAALKAIVDCYGTGVSPEAFVRHVAPFIDEGRAAIARAEGRP